MSGPSSPPAFPPSPPASPPLPPPFPRLPPTPPPVRTCGFIGCSVEDHLGIYLGTIFGLLCCCALCTYSVYKTVLRPRGVTESLESSRGDGAGRSGRHRGSCGLRNPLDLSRRCQGHELSKSPSALEAARADAEPVQIQITSGEPSATSYYGGEDRGSRNAMGRHTMERADTGLTQAERAAQSQQKADMARARRQQGKGSLAAGARMNSHL